MGMLGQWISRPVRFVAMDKALNAMTIEQQENLKTAVKAGALWTDLRKDFGFVPIDSGLAANAQQNLRDHDCHIEKHWYNSDDKGWWPLDPTEEIRTEALYQTIRLSLASPVDGKPKPVSSYWLCPGVRHFEIAICESPDEITVLVLTPPEGKLGTLPGSHHRGNYNWYLDQRANQNHEVALGVGPCEFKIVRSNRLTFEVLTSRFPKNQRVKIECPPSQTFYRRVKETPVEKNGAVHVKVDAGKGVNWHKIAQDQVLTVCSMPLEAVPHYEDSRDLLEEGVMVVSREDQASQTNTVDIVDKSGVPGVAVRRQVRTVHNLDSSPVEDVPGGVSGGGG